MLRIQPVLTETAPGPGFHVQYVAADVDQLVVGLFEKSTDPSTVPQLGYFSANGQAFTSTNPLTATAFTALQGALGSQVTVGTANKADTRRYLFATIANPALTPSPVTLTNFPNLSATAPIHQYNLFACALDRFGDVIGYYEKNLVATDLTGASLPVTLNYGGLSSADLSTTLEGTAAAPLSSITSFEIGLFDTGATPNEGMLSNGTASVPFDGTRSWFPALEAYLVGKGQSSTYAADPHRYLICDYPSPLTTANLVARLSNVPPGNYAAFAMAVRNGQVSMGNAYQATVPLTGGSLSMPNLGVLTTGPSIWSVAGNGTPGALPPNAPISPTSAALNTPCGAAVDMYGNVFFADQANNAVEEINELTGGQLSTVAGTGTTGSLGDGGPATSAELNSPCGVAVDGNGNVYVADTGNNKVRKFTVGGNISTIAGTGIASYSGDMGLATSAALNSPSGVAVDSSNNVYIADTNNNRIRMIASTTSAYSFGVYQTAGYIYTIAGPGTVGTLGDGGLATSANLSSPGALALDASNDVYVADTGNNRVRLVLNSSDVISTVAGNGTGAYSGDGVQAVNTSISGPKGLAFNTSTGNLYISDTGNNRIRMVAGGIITTLAGTAAGSNYSGDLGMAVAAQLATPLGIAFNKMNNSVFIADSANHRIREIQ